MQRGQQVSVRDAFGEQLERRALGGQVMGTDFLVVWVCSEEEWITSRDEGREPKGVPWPAEDVRPLQAAHGP